MRNTWTVAVTSVAAAILVQPISADAGKPSGDDCGISIRVEEPAKRAGSRNARRRVASAVVFVEGWATVDHAAALMLP